MVDSGGTPGVPTPIPPHPSGTQFFHFYLIFAYFFFEKVPPLDMGAPEQGWNASTGNPGSTAGNLNPAIILIITVQGKILCRKGQTSQRMTLWHYDCVCKKLYFIPVKFHVFFFFCTFPFGWLPDLGPLAEGGLYVSTLSHMCT